MNRWREEKVSNGGVVVSVYTDQSRKTDLCMERDGVWIIIPSGMVPFVVAAIRDLGFETEIKQEEETRL